ncbi:uncharacterized protein I303_105183 [Kwoniella dejecticola CBS 10117]|uniref:Uncharacterized protein n=1 Tax=Kwoniella dejecticola CBS 10117 TaxID=1296121 RepID=A0A1A6A371_9TREE|nr:uncharacterized protein I303_05370 [Kwoniella dejecticola CBS 10117]OBR84512.1 hypothetical protein I303_05370 [Kwoniella dejecticola CBS 10117]
MAEQKFPPSREMDPPTAQQPPSSNDPITTQPEAGKKPLIKPFIDTPPQGEGTRSQPLGSEALGNPAGCGPDHFGKWLMACARC